MIQKQNWIRFFGFLGFLAVALGAFGAHGLKSRVSSEALEWWKTGVDYLVWHTLAGLVVLTRQLESQKLVPYSVRFFTAGMFFFSGSLFLMTVTDIRILGAITPIGGLLFLLGWISFIRESKI